MPVHELLLQQPLHTQKRFSMTTAKLTSRKMGESRTITVSLKAFAHIRAQGQSSAVMVAGAGIVETLGNAIHSYEFGESVVVLMRETQQISKTDRVTADASNACRIPPGMSFEDAVSLVYPFAAGLKILQDELGLGFPPRTMNRDVKDVPAALLLGGECALAQTLTQLLYIASPTTNILVACRAEDNGSTDDQEEAVRPFCFRAVENGAKYGIDAAAPDLIEHLQAAIDGYGGPLKLILDGGGEVAKREEIKSLLHEDGKLVDCTRVQVGCGTLEKKDLSKVMASLEKLMVDGKLRPPVCTDIYVRTL